MRVWSPPGAPKVIVVAVHGFNDYGYAFDRAARAWTDAGVQTYAYDQRGFGATKERGRWAGTDTLVADLRAVSELVAAAHPGTPLYLVGVSMGGAVVMTTMAREADTTVAGVVLVAPAVWGWRTLNPLYRITLWISAHVAPGAKVSGRGLGIKPSDNRDMLIALSKDPLIIKETRVDSVYGLVTLMDEALDAAARLSLPTLVLYGANDEIIPKEPTYRMLRQLTAPHRVAVYPEGFHMLLRDLQATLVHDDIAAWMADPQAPLPSGQDKDWESFFRAD